MYRLSVRSSSFDVLGIICDLQQELANNCDIKQSYIPWKFQLHRQSGMNAPTNSSEKNLAHVSHRTFGSRS